MIAFMCAPSWLKIVLLRCLGHEVGNNVHIGMSYLDVRRIVLKDGVRIASFNYFKNLQELVMLEGARIGGWANWFTATAHNNDGNAGFGCLTIGKGSNITSRHHFDLQEKVTIGDQTLIAGFGSAFFTHSYSPTVRNVNRPIHIDEHCYVGSHSIFTPGSAVGPGTFVGAGSVVSRDLSYESAVLVAGNPAGVLKACEPALFFFNADHGSFLTGRHAQLVR